MQAQHSIYINRYNILPIIVVIGQFIGVNIKFSILILASLFFIMSSKIKIEKLNNEILHFSLILILISFINLYQKTPDLYSLLMWGQFFFIAIIPILIVDVNKLLSSFIKIILVLFCLDFFVNIATFAGLNLPGIVEVSSRPGELFPRMQGIMNSNLFSSSISFISLCIILDRNILTKHKYIKLLLAIFIFINIGFAGAKRTYILSLAVIFIKLFPFIRKSSFKIISYVFVIVFAVVLLTISNATSNLSNSLRSQLWLFSVEKISHKPLLGYGIYFPDASKAIPNIETLSEMVVTESFILAIGYSFGVVGIIVFIIFLFKILLKGKKGRFYKYQYGIFLGLSIELFFGGTLSNTLSVFIYFLCAYAIIEDDLSKKTEQKELYI